MKSVKEHTGLEVLSADFWARTWRESQQAACLPNSQKDHPQRWRRFYDQMAPLWEAMTGGGPGAAQAVSGALAAQGLMTQGSTVLEVGCGSGSLTLAMAEREARITALDDSSGMLMVLEDRTKELPNGEIRPVKSDWQKYEPEDRHDLAIAAFFPPGMTPAGIERLECLAHKTCALVIGTGHEAIPLRRALWEKIFKRPLPDIRFQLTCALGFLLASGRRPDLRHLSWQVKLDVPKDQAVRFYESYFAIFGKTGPAVKQLIAEVLEAHSDQGKLKLSGEASAALVTWPVKVQSR